MINYLVNKLIARVEIADVNAHCDIPCKIYDPVSAQLGALSVLRFLDLIAELDGPDQLGVVEMATLSRLVQEKETHAELVKKEVRVLWGDYFKQPHIDQYPQLGDLVHQILQIASACKQNIDQANGHLLVKKINELTEIFWGTKGIDTYTAVCPYPPSQEVVYPKLV